MGSNKAFLDDDLAARLLWQVKVISTKEVESLPVASQQSFLNEASSCCFPPLMMSQSHDSDDEGEESNNSSSTGGSSGARRRTVSVESVDMVAARSSSSPPFMIHTNNVSAAAHQSAAEELVDHHDWSKRTVTSSPLLSASMSNPSSPSSLLLATPEGGKRYGKRKRESFVGTTSKTTKIRATLKKKFSWKQYPEVSFELRDEVPNPGHMWKTRRCYKVLHFTQHVAIPYHLTHS